MAFGKSSRADSRRTSSSFCSTTTIVVFVALCLVGVWMMTSSTITPVEMSPPSSKSDAKDQVPETDSKPFEDNSGDITEDSEKLVQATREENPVKVNEDKTNDEAEHTSKTLTYSDRNGKSEEEKFQEGGDANMETDTGSQADAEGKNRQQKSDGQDKNLAQNSNKGENNEQQETNSEKKSEEEEKSDGDEKDKGQIEEKMEQSEDQETGQNSGDNNAGNQDKDKASNEVFPSGAQSELLNETNTQNGAWSTQAAESKNEKEVQASASSKGQLVGYNWKLCNVTAGADYIPCLDNEEAIRKLPSTKHYEHRERHCPKEAPTCLVHLPDGYKRPIDWPKSRDKIWYSNVPHTKLAVVKGHQNWVKVSGEYLTFPGGGTQFKNGALHYVDFIQQSLSDIAWGKQSRVVLDVGCGVASFGGYLFDRDVLTMSFAPKDEHEAQVQFALERGIPAVSSVMGTKRLPYPSKVFDVVHCARCRVPWHIEGGMLLLELNSDKGNIGGKAPPALAGNSSVISEPVLVSTDNNGIILNLEKGTPSNLDGDGGMLSATCQDAEKQGFARYGTSNDPEKLREEQAAIKAQAAFRGYLARRAFRALKGIIRLQALIRGHLVRRQAVATLRAMQGIVRLQAMVRGQRVQCSSIGFKMHTMFAQGNTALLSSLLVAKPLRVQYDQGDPNSVFSWLERWTSTRFWKPLSQPKKAADLKSQTRRCNYAMETESGRSKRNVRRNSAVNVDSAQNNVTSEPEKTKRNLRKLSGSPADSVREPPQSELEKVKRNLRKITNSITEASDRLEVETEKPIQSVRKVSSSPSDVSDQGLEESAEKIEKDVILTPDTKSEVETVLKSTVAEGPADTLPVEYSATESHQFQSIDNEEKALVVNGELQSKEEQPCLENQKTSKRRSSFSERSEYAENGLQNTTVLPNYMASTESAKAKLRGQFSPRFVSDSVDKNGITRRHSLPSSTNGKLNSHSPQTQKLVPANGKGGNRSLFSSRDGNERAIQVEWRR